MSKTMLMGLAVLLTVGCLGCGTIRGMGEDISTVGHWLIKGSNNAQQGNSQS